MRRLTSARRPTFRLAQVANPRRGAPRPRFATQMATLVRTFADASNHLARRRSEPLRGRDGLMGRPIIPTGSPLPADLSTRVNLAPYLGLNVTMTGGGNPDDSGGERRPRDVSRPRLPRTRLR